MSAPVEPHGALFADARQRLAEWSDEDLHVLRSARFHEPTYRNPAEIRRDVKCLLDEVARLRQGLWDVAALAGMDADGDETPDHMVYPNIVALALREVQRLREDYEVESDSFEGLMIRVEREATKE